MPQSVGKPNSCGISQAAWLVTCSMVTAACTLLHPVSLMHCPSHCSAFLGIDGITQSPTIGCS